MKNNFTSDKKKDYNDSSDFYLPEYNKLLDKFKIKIGDTVKLQTIKGEFTGIVMPRYESFRDDCLVIKLKSGYNVGILIKNISNISVSLIDDSLIKYNIHVDKKNDSHDNNKDQTDGNNINNNTIHSLPRILLISTGGTIASKIDYRTGGVTSILNASELYGIFPELSNFANIVPEFLFNEYSENIVPHHWSILSKRISDAVNNENYDGIIVSHGTDTLHYSSSALSFTLQHVPIPIILVGSQRSSDRPSSDAYSNLLGAIKFITKTDYCGIFVCMHHNTSDEVIACQLGTRVRKNHTSKRDAFKSLDSIPFALINDDQIKVNSNLFDVQKKSSTSIRDFIAKPLFDDRVFLLKFYPGLDPSILEIFLTLKYKIIIIEGTGLGHVNKNCFPYIEKLLNAGIIIFMTSQCIFGRVRLTVYDTGRDLLELGIIPLSDMSPETALVKAMWALNNSSNTEELIKIMNTNLANEISSMLPIIS